MLITSEYRQPDKAASVSSRVIDPLYGERHFFLVQQIRYILKTNLSLEERG